MDGEDKDSASEELGEVLAVAIISHGREIKSGGPTGRGRGGLDQD